MKKSVIMIGILGLFLELTAKDYTKVVQTRTQMLLETKQLLQRQEMLKNKKAAWRERQLVIIDDFNKIYETDEHFGTDNNYGKKRLEKRQKDFYTSLQEKNDQIEEKLSSVRRKLSRMKKQFSHYYTVQMTTAEINGGVAPKVADKQNKVTLLKEYLSSKSSWSACLQKNKSFDAKRVAIENSADFNAKVYEVSNAKLDEAVEKNAVKLNN